MIYDTLIIGTGCAGYTAAVYAARYKLNVYLIGAEAGGMGNTAAEVGNWPGDQEVKGPELMTRMREHAESFDTVTSKAGHVHAIVKTEHGFKATLDEGKTVEANTVIFATGSNKRKLGAPGEKEFAGKGVTYCATCDAFFFRNKTVAVLGGGDAAVEGAAIVAQVAKKVYLVHRRNEFRAEPYWVDKVKEKDNVEFVLERNVTKIFGENTVTGITLDTPYEGSNDIAVDGVFIEIGAIPATELAQTLGCEVDEANFLKVQKNQASVSVPGVFGAGDVTDASNRFAQFTTAAGEASVAANAVFAYLQEKGE